MKGKRGGVREWNNRTGGYKRSAKRTLKVSPYHSSHLLRNETSDEYNRRKKSATRLWLYELIIYSSVGSSTFLFDHI
jgi:hypothetical protein